MTKRVLVTGGTGFTGGHLCRRLVAEGYQVRALVRKSSRYHNLETLGVELVIGDLEDPSSLEPAVAEVETVYHLAALFRPENVTRQDFLNTNVEGTRHLIEASIKAGVHRFVHCSTVGVHGDIKEPPATEKTPYAPGDDYQDSKTEGEKVVLQYMDEGKLSVVIFRPGGIFGPGDLRFLKLFRAIKKRRFLMLGSGEVLYQLIYIDDLIEGILRCGTYDKASGKIYILTGVKPITLNHFVQEIADVVEAPFPKLRLPVMPVYWCGYICELICKPFGINPPIYRRRVDFFRKTRSFDISKAQEQLSFTPTTEFKKALKTTADWYTQHDYM
ncbi:MAG: NAD-dependent epimerase/dehydratase family protein [Waterburya sp.]